MGSARQIEGEEIDGSTWTCAQRERYQHAFFGACCFMGANVRRKRGDLVGVSVLR